MICRNVRRCLHGHAHQTYCDDREQDETGSGSLHSTLILVDQSADCRSSHDETSGKVADNLYLISQTPTNKTAMLHTAIA